MDDFEDDLRELRRSMIAGLRFRRRDTKPSKDGFDHERNFHAVRSALLRGDRDVTLLNQDTWDLNDDRTEHLVRHAAEGDPAAAANKVFPTHAPPKQRPLEPGEAGYDKVQSLISPQPPYDGVQFHLESVIGSGGNGVVLGVTAKFENGRARKLAIKVPKKHTDQPNLDAERRWHQQYNGATHTVQHIDIADLARQNKVNGYSYPGGSQPFDEKALGILILERADHGNLWDFMNAVVRQRLRIPDQALWSIWLCMIKMLASVDYQPSSNASQNGNFEAFLQTAQRPRSPFSTTSRTEPSVIMSISITNSKILHDFDDKWSKDMRRAWADDGWDEEDYWTMRSGPKGLYTPEQLSQQWDSFQPLERRGKEKFRGEDFGRGVAVAGRYGSWTNVFLAGTMMECVMTGLYLRHPFCYQEYEFTYPSRRRRRTYGWRLAQVTDGDPDLREIVMKCQIADPRVRPTTVELLEHARNFMPSNDDAETVIRAFYDQVFNAPTSANA